VAAFSVFRLAASSPYLAEAMKIGVASIPMEVERKKRVLVQALLATGRIAAYI
jgi:hypothetical protein